MNFGSPEENYLDLNIWIGGVVIKEPFCSQEDREWKALEMEKRVLEWVPLCSG